jgi:hypothetical protein
METGHAKNVANFEAITIILAGLGAGYDPQQTLIRPAALQDKLAEAKVVLAEVDAAEADRTIKVDEVQAEFGGLDKFVVNIKRVAAVELNDEALNRDLQTIVNRFTAKTRAAAAGSPSTPGLDDAPKTRSTSMRSRDNQIAHLADLVALLKSKGGYKPTDPDYKIETIEARIAALAAKNNAAKSSEAALGNAQNARDRILYDPDTGILKLVKLIKTQLALKPGKTSAAYRQVNGLEFRRVK